MAIERVQMGDIVRVGYANHKEWVCPAIVLRVYSPVSDEGKAGKVDLFILNQYTFPPFHFKKRVNHRDTVLEKDEVPSGPFWFDPRNL